MPDIITNYQATVAETITDKVQKNSVTPYIVGNSLSTLADIVGSLKTVIVVNDPNPVILNWQTDLVDGINSYAGKHGNEFGIASAFYFNGETWQVQAVDVQQEYAGGQLTTVTINFGDNYPAKLIII